MEDRFKAFTLLINSISRNIYNIKNEEMTNLGLKSTHLSCLYYLYKYKKLTPVELCEVCQENKAGVSRAIKDLQQMQFVEEMLTPNSKYRVPLALTEKGVAITQKIDARVAYFLEQASSGLTDAQRKTMYESLELIDNNLKELVKGEK